MTTSTPSPDNCPTCGRRIIDTDDNGMEADDGQRWCRDHYQEEVGAALEELAAAVESRPLDPCTEDPCPVCDNQA